MSDDDIRIEQDDLAHVAVRTLLREHLADMAITSPSQSVHALDLDGLRQPDIIFWTAWSGDELLGFAALKHLDHLHGEIKSMRTATSSRRHGIGARLLAHLIEQAQQRGYRKLSLETGSQDFFAPARRFYERHGFVACPPFAAYLPDPHSVFMTRAL